MSNSLMKFYKSSKYGGCNDVGINSLKNFPTFGRQWSDAILHGLELPLDGAQLVVGGRLARSGLNQLLLVVGQVLVQPRDHWLQLGDLLNVLFVPVKRRKIVGSQNRWIDFRCFRDMLTFLFLLWRSRLGNWTVRPIPSHLRTNQKATSESRNALTFPSYIKPVNPRILRLLNCEMFDQAAKMCEMFSRVY